jgi:ornithine cyclodeaminase/alanine dehydrogenase-like protein (mu-crystallin family)
VTERRTAALSALAVRRLRNDASPGRLLVIGAGVQARAHVEAFIEWLGVREVTVAARDGQAADRLVRHAARLGARAQAAGDLAAAVRAADLIVTATSASAPVLPDHVRDGAIVCAVGAYTPAMAELPPALVHRSALIVDSLEACRAEAGDLLQAGVEGSSVRALQDFDGVVGRAGPVVFKSVGCALWDLAAAHAWAQAALD